MSQKNEDGWDLGENADMDKVETRKEPQIGRYLCRIAEMQLRDRKEKNKGNFSGDPDDEDDEKPKKYFNLKFEIIDADTAENEPSIGRTIYDIFGIAQNVLWKLKALISSCGLDAHGSKIPNLEGHEVVLDIYEDDYNPQNKQLRTKRYKNPHEGGWSGLTETRDATTSGKADGEKVGGQAAGGTAITKPAATGGATGLAGKKAKVGASDADAKKDDKEVEI